jgi:hypothetical protein
MSRRPPMKTSRRSRKRVTTAAAKQDFPRWFKSDQSQAIAEFLAYQFYLDRLIGIEPSADREPYSLYKRETVVAFLEKLCGATAKATLATTNAAV